MEIYLDLIKKEVEDSLVNANKRAIERDGEEGKNNALYADAEFKSDGDCGFVESTETIGFSGNLYYEGKNLGYMSMSLPLDFEDIISIIEVYRKKLGKLKTVLEATKD